MRSRTFAAFGLAIVLASFAREPARAAPPDRFYIKTATLAPEGSTWMNIMQEMDAEVRLRTGDQVGFRFYPGGVAGDETTVIQKMNVGQLDAGGFTGVGLGAIVPRIRLLELPFQYPDYAAFDRVLHALEADLVADYDRAGYKLLGWSETGLAYIFSARPIRSEEEMRAARPWCWDGDPLAAQAFREFGVAPTPVALPDVLTSLQTGLIDTVYVSPLAAIALQWHTRVRFMTDLPIGNGIGGLLLTQRAWDQIPEACRGTVAEVVRRHMDRLCQQTRHDNDEALNVLRQRGIRVVSVEAGRDVHFRELGAQAARALVGRLYSEEDLQRVLAILGG